MKWLTVYINYCSLVWGFSTKTNIESLFRAQKKGKRAFIPGFINYRYRSGGTLTGHTKSYFAKYDILTLQNVIVLNALVFMHKARHFPLDLPRSMRKTVAENWPLPGAPHESSNEWLQHISYHLYTRSVFYKGPLLSIIPKISELITPPTLLNAKIYKKDIRKALMKYQSSGDTKEWQSGNFLLFDIPGLRKSPKNLTLQITNSYKLQTWISIFFVALIRLSTKAFTNYAIP